MNDADEKFKASAIINKLFAQLEPNLMQNASDVSTAWYETVSSIRNFTQDETKKVQIGTQLADHSRIIDLKNGVLTVETDHPGRLQLLQIHKRYILEGLHRKVPDLEIKNILYRLK